MTNPKPPPVLALDRAQAEAIQRAAFHLAMSLKAALRVTATPTGPVTLTITTTSKDGGQ